MEDAYIHYLAPALVAGVFGVVSALVTSRLSGAAERRKNERDAKARQEDLQREFSERYAELQATNRAHAESIRQQFARAYLRVETPDPKMADRFYIAPGAKLVIGRTQEADIIINDVNISRRSAMVEMSGEKLFITDLASTNGTFVNNTLLTRGQHLLADGDKISWGNTVVSVHMLRLSKPV
jgi:FHA domain